MLYPNEYRLGIIIYGVLFKPLMMLFGEMFLGEIHHYAFEGIWSVLTHFLKLILSDELPTAAEGACYAAETKTELL